jgi:hypothetical protein
MAKESEKVVAVPGAEDFLALAEGSEVREALEYNLSVGERITMRDLARVKTTGGGSKWLWEERGEEKMEPEIVGALVGCFRLGMLWPTEDSVKGVPPVLVTHDLVTARRISSDIGDLDAEVLEAARIGDNEYDWRKLPYTKVGTSRDGNSARAKESRVLCILRREDAFPLRIIAGVGSLGAVTTFIKTLPVPSYRCIVALRKEKAMSRGGQEYYRIVPKLVGTLGKEAGAEIRRLYTDPLMADMESDAGVQSVSE